MKISPTDSLLYNRIKFFTEKGEYKCCTQNNYGLASYFNIKAKETVSRSISKLKKAGYIKELDNLSFRGLATTDKKFVFNYNVNTDDKSVITNDNSINTDDKSVMLMSLLNDKSVIDAMINRSSSDDKSINHILRYNIRYLNKELNKEKKEENKTFSSECIQCSDFLENIIKTKKKINPKTAKWKIEIDKLNRLDGVSWERIIKGLQWYQDNIGGAYVPVIESGVSLREKFIKLENAIGRGQKSTPLSKVDKNKETQMQEYQQYMERQNGK